ncbi:MsnO8 family LLM class oxidoreductase [Cytobacillus sp. Hz8]|uniref:MsnO8 family LLM class oxidoreductase n=1 Tax=Cytobacillus sp. Hz8 TaxID=3347168 RepID=UPI0035DE08F6
MSYKLGILDQSPIFPGGSAHEALQETLHLARNAEKWGYSRFWVSEHHHSEQVAGASPEILISHLLAQTEEITIGSGGVLLQHYSPFKAAENFHVLANLAPGRVDLGIGKAPGGLPLSTKALQYGTVNDGKDFEERFSTLQALIENSLEETHPLFGIQATPIPKIKPKLFLLGASPESAAIAVRYQTSFVYGLFFNSDRRKFAEAARLYHQRNPNGSFKVGIAVIAASIQKEAEEIAQEHSKIVLVHLKSGRTVKVLTREQAELFGQQAGESYEIEEQKVDIVAGTPQFVQKALNEIHQKFGVDEFILHTPIPKKEERFRSFELLSPIRWNQADKQVGNLVQSN